MFSTTKLFASVPCPDQKKCIRPHCPLGHVPNVRQHELPYIPTRSESVTPSTPGPSRISASASPKKPTPRAPDSVLSKRPNAPSPDPKSTLVHRAGDSPNKRLKAVVACVECKRSNLVCDGSQPCRPCQNRNMKPLCKYLTDEAKIEKSVLTTNRPLKSNPVKTVPASSKTSNGCPVLRINAALSQVAIPVRQAMTKNIYEAFLELYSDLLVENPELPAEHALAQEAEIYAKSTKLTYRSASILSVSSIKKRPKPNSISHDSVGTDGMRQKRRDEFDKLRALRLTKKHLEPLVMSIQEMQKWGYVTEIPDGPGGDRPTDEGQIRDCDRCRKPFKVMKKEEAEECIFHWGRPFTSRTNGDRSRIYNCCWQPVSSGEGCTRGPHVFYESSPQDLHARQPFSTTRPALEGGSDTAFDVLALDCEMIHTTAGISCARVSIVDGGGEKVLDELVKMDDGVEVIDFNTRFSGVTDETYQTALLNLKAVRRSLDAFINSKTIIIGHALDNDLKTLRMVHHRCVDTTTLYLHRAGPPYRKKLRDLAREFLDRRIQTGDGDAGHSSLEDSIATLDLVRQFVLDKKTKPAQTIVPPTPQPAGPDAVKA